jgi:Mg2+/Co2+ transporter CorB
MDWGLPEEGPKTLNGLIIDHLDQIPTNNICIQLKSYKLETLKIETNKVVQLKVTKTS